MNDMAIENRFGEDVVEVKATVGVEYAAKCLEQHERVFVLADIDYDELTFGMAELRLRLVPIEVYQKIVAASERKTAMDGGMISPE